MYKEQAVFEQLTLSDFKKWSSSASKTFNNYTITMTNNSDKEYEFGVFIYVAYFCVYSTGWSGEVRVVFKHFQNLKNVILNISNLLPCKLTISQC